MAGAAKAEATASPDGRAGAARAERVKGHAAMLAFAALIAGSFSLGARAAPFVDAAALNALRFALAAALMGALLVSVGPGFRRMDFRAPWRFLALGAALSVYFVLMFEALKIASPVSTGAVFTLIPLMSAGFGRLLSGQRTPPAVLAALGLGALGAIWVIFGADPGRILAFDIGPGEALFFVGCVGHALYTPLVPRLNRGEPVMAFTFGVLSAAALIIGAVGAPALAATDWAAMPPVVWICLAYLSVVTTAGTFFLLQYAALRLPAGKVMAYGYLTPAFVGLYEGLWGAGWPPPAVWAGVAATAGALLALAASADGAMGRGAGR